MKKALIGAGVIALSAAAFSSAAVTQEQLNIIFTHHSSTGNTFWQAVKAGFDDACERFDARCQMLFTQTEGSIEQQAANMETAIVTSPDAIVTSLVDNNAFDEIVGRAREQGIIVIGSNVDDLEGAAGNDRQAFIGQGFIPAGFTLGEEMSKHFPADGPIKALVGVSAPGQNWSEQRAAGVIQFLEQYAADNPDREVSWERIDSGTDLAITSERVGAFLNAKPETNVYFDTGFWEVSVVQTLRDRGVGPGEVLLGGFDLVPQVLDEISAGYIQVTIDQQPYMQGYLPVVQVHLMKTIGLGAFDVDTGQGVVTAENVAEVVEFSRQGVR